MMHSSNTVTEFLIGEIGIQLHTWKPITVNEAFYPFVRIHTENPIKIYFQQKEKIDFGAGNTVFSDQIFSVKEKESNFVRIFHDHKNENKPYAISRFVSQDKEEICCLNGHDNFFNEAYNCFAHIALEEILLSRSAVILHGAFINTVYGGIIFSGPSGIGKSTQAELWTRFYGARLINGDRTILRRKGPFWYGYGSPYAGSSKCYRDESEKICAIVFLEQSDQCMIRRMKPVEAFMRLYSGLTVNTWNKKYVEKITEIGKNIVTEVPSYLYSCTQGKESADYLTHVLKEGEYGEQ